MDTSSGPRRRPSLWWGPAYLLLWTLPGLFSTAQLSISYGLRGDYPPVTLLLGITLPGWYIWGLLAPLVAVAAWRWPVPPPRPLRLLLHLGLNLLLGITWVALSIAVRQLLSLPGGTQFEVVAVNALGSSVVTYWAIALGVSWIRSQRESRREQLRAAELDAELSRARLQALSARLQPHFLFNTMHAISADLRSDPDRAEQMLVDLADLLRMVVEVQEAEIVPLERELDFTRRYLALQQTRLADRVTIRWEAPTGARVGVPTLLLQPLVENAVEHGAALRRGDASISVRVQVTEGRLRVEIEDDGPGLPDAFELSSAEGVGLGTTRARLREHFGSDHRLEIAPRPEGGTRVFLDIPAPPLEVGT